VLNFPTFVSKGAKRSKNLAEPRELTCILGNADSSRIYCCQSCLYQAHSATSKVFLAINIQAVIDVAEFEVAPTPTFTVGIDLWIKAGIVLNCFEQILIT
jgi:hypothetical protein